MVNKSCRKSSQLLNESVLVLNKYFLAIQVTNVKEAIVTLVSGKSRVVDQDYVMYDLPAWEAKSFQLRLDGMEMYPGVLRSPSITLVAPQVILIPDCVFDNPAIKTVKYSRRNVLQRDNYTCQYCGHRFPKQQLTLDHIIPKSKGGRSSWTNVVTCCKACNADKGDRLLTDLGWKLLKKPTQPKWRSHVGTPFGEEKKKYWEVFLG
jgi:hypothetical protein